MKQKYLELVKIGYNELELSRYDVSCPVEIAKQMLINYYNENGKTLSFDQIIFILVNTGITDWKKFKNLMLKASLFIVAKEMEKGV